MHRRLGIEERMDAIGRRVIRDYMPDQHRELFGKLPFMLVGSVDAAGQPWASMLAGRPGFVTTPDAKRLRFSALPALGDPLGAHLAPGAPLGLLGIELETRRRNRVNGTVGSVDRDGFDVHVEQSFGNCPKYIALRRHHLATSRPRVVSEPRGLSQAARDLIRGADTLFIASAAPGDGVDVSHRGGGVGFVGLQEGNDGLELTIPDYAGNSFFNTIGNIIREPRVGLLFLDFSAGHALQLVGFARLDEDTTPPAAPGGVERSIHVTISGGHWLRDAVPIRWESVPTP
jgi:predicted pyridoxine 5'-phosphate oxidase superfamily flavin-nucleotide-binding protein